MLKNLFYILLVFSMDTLVVYGQLVEPSAQQLGLYLKAKKSYEKANYIASKNFLETHLSPPFTRLTPYAWFYYALASYKAYALDEATANFEKIIQFYPEWPQKEEVLYWLAQIHFERQGYLEAFRYLQNIQDPQLVKDAIGLKNYFLRQAGSIDWVDTLRYLYPNDLSVAKAWLCQQEQLPFLSQDLESIQAIIHRFGLTHSFIDPLQDLGSIKKERYHVAVLLPFFMDEEGWSHKNEFVLDLYRGLQMAVTQLYQRGIHIILHPYDTKKSVSVTENLLAEPAMKTMDLIIGPLYANTLPLVAAFAKENQINLVNPLSVNANVVGRNPFVYLLKPSLETQACKAAYFMQQNSDLPQAHIGIVYGTTPEDSLKAHLYKRWVERLTAKEIDLMLELDEKSAKKFLNRFRESIAQKGEKEILDSLTHIYIASQDELVVANVLSTLQIRKLSPTILADEGCIKKDLLTIDQLQQHRLFFIAPDYIDYQREGIYTFRGDFYQQFGLYPSYYAMVGYDMMLFLGQMLFDYGVYFTKYRHNTLFPGQIFSGFLYGLHYDNQQVPIIQFKDARFVVCNMGEPLP